MFGKQRNAHADAAIDVTVAIGQRLMELRRHPRQHRVQIGPGAQARQQHGELVATHACDQVSRPHRFTQPLCDGAEQGVAYIMSRAVVDPFELIDIDQHHCHLAASTACRTGRLGQCGHEMRAVGQPGQRVGHREVGEVPLGILAIGDVDDAG